MDFTTLRKYKYTAHAVIVILGLLCILFANILKDTWYTVLISIGTSLLASAFVSVISCYFISKETALRDTVLTWGLKNIFAQRSEINPVSEKLLTESKTLDIIACGLKSFLDARKAILEQRLREGNFKLRILTIDPESKTCQAMDSFEDVPSNYTRETILKLIEWVKSVDSPNIELRVYEGIPLEFYFKYDTDLFVGPHHPKTSQQTVTWQFSTSERGAHIYLKYFDDAWDKATPVQ